MNWILEIKAKACKDVHGKCVVMCWAIWHTRNKRLFEGIYMAAKETVNFAIKYWHDLWNATAEVLNSNIRTNRGAVSWVRPEMNVVKINFDAAINKVDGVCGIGVIARTNLGECVGWNSRCIKQSLDPTAAEAQAAFMAVEMARTNNWRRIVIEGDSMEVICAVCEPAISEATNGNIIEDIKRKRGWFEHFQIQHIFREANQVAHEIAALSKLENYALEDLPVTICNIISAE
ncbi:PREDICTED: uncharacterized protein LOC105974524 [Erythranthe guttata]|uniref:uncharacterized protein LOC105974524 n=1 Tax=Erythranthe guttata TaxID=4155 RepID=UPI00064D8DE1|nr:PREDICTED: uncharacterized protein LOC105974524 [Erythranthe guttata]|eukprot:XP_012855093.1 PREDICTED: uncharacterized protein LOC105974524 [Erythranthe guttata]